MKLTATREEMHHALHNAMAVAPPKKDWRVWPSLSQVEITQKGSTWIIVATDSYMLTVSTIRAEHWLDVAGEREVSQFKPGAPESITLDLIDLEQLVKMAKPKKAQLADEITLEIGDEYVSLTTVESHEMIERTNFGNQFVSWRGLFIDCYKDKEESRILLGVNNLARLGKLLAPEVQTIGDNYAATPMQFRMGGPLKPVNFHLGNTEGMIMPIRKENTFEWFTLATSRLEENS